MGTLPNWARLGAVTSSRTSRLRFARTRHPLQQRPIHQSDLLTSLWSGLGLGVFFSFLTRTCSRNSLRLLALPPLFLFIALSSGTKSHAAEGTRAVDVLSVFEARYRAAKSLSATFLQEYSENGRVTRKEAGKSYFLHPGKMRWDYEAPEKNTFLADGKYVWFITPEDHTATRMAAKKSKDWRTPLAFLTNGIKLSRICAQVERAADVSPRQAGYKAYRCELRGAEDAEANREGGGKQRDAAKVHAG